MRQRWAGWKRPVKRAGLVLLGVFVVLQLVPYGWTKSNPPVVSDAPWPSAEAESIARQSCYSCHSNETEWPIYSYVAPASWLVRSDVEAGRKRLNFSEWMAGEQAEDDAEDAIDEIEDGAMPLPKYTMVHRSARLTAEERQVLVDALRTMGGDDGRDDDGRDDDGSGRGRGRGRAGDDDREDDGGSGGGD